MGLFDALRVSQAIGTIVASPRGGAATAKAEERLRSVGARAVPKIIEALPHDRSGRLVVLLTELVGTGSLPAIVTHGLLSEDPVVVGAVKRALLDAPRVDPNRLLDLYVSKGGTATNIAEILLQHKQEISAKSTLRLLELAAADNDGVLFKLIDQIANPGIVSALIGFLRNAEWEGRYYIAQTISRFPSEGVRDALVRLLSDPHKKVRQAALDGVAALGMPVPIEKVCALLRDPDMLVQSRAIEAAVRINDPSSVRHLLEILQDESEHARRAAVEVLNNVGNANAIKDLLFALKDKDWWVRVRAADALGAIGGPKVIDAVLQLLGDDDEFMRRTAVEILNTTKDERAFDYLVKALGDRDWWVRERAIDALANLGDRRAVPHLVRLLATEDQTTSVALRALAQIGDPSALGAVLFKLDSPDESIQREAVDALGALVDNAQADAVAQALAAFDPPNPEIRDAAHRLAAELQTRFRQGLSGPRSSRPGAATSSPAAARSTSGTIAPTMIGNSVALPAEPAAGGGQRRAMATAGAHEPERLDFAGIKPGVVLANRYRVVREIGRGGFGTVLQVEDQVVGEEIALKLINPQLVQDESTIARFVHEVRYARRIAHENVIRVYDFVSVGDCHAISMEYFPSHALTRRIRRGLHRDIPLGLKFVRAMVGGMIVAHNAGIMHRDLKPANVLVNDEDVLKIVDFGLAAACSHADSRVTKTGHLVGTPTYMSPEQARGLDIDARTDIYSLGVIMYEIFTGTPPYSGDNPLSVLYQHLEGGKEPPSKRNPAISPVLEGVILKAMALKPEDRYANARELLDDLDAPALKDAA